eukprot:gene11260-11409_t
MGMLSKSVDDEAVPSSGSKSKLLKWAAAAGLVLLGAAIALAIALPLTLRQKSSSSRGDAVKLETDGSTVTKLSGTTRTYYLAAEPIDWDYAPAGKDLCKNEPFSDKALLYTTQGIGTKYKKAVYREYEDDTFTKLKPRSADEEHMGLLGPALHAEVGDVMRVVLKNNLDFPINIMAGGADPHAPSTQLWAYRSTVDPIRDTQAGLAGFLVIARPGMLDANGRPSDVDKEFYMMLQVFNEKNSPFYESNSANAAKQLANMSETDVDESNLKYTVNGYIYCNLPGLNMTVGDRARWYVSSLGSEDAIHTAHWHGIVFNVNGNNMDQVVVQASSMVVMDAVTDNPGTWLFHCHLTDHIHGGMMALFTITGTAPAQQLKGKTREYFIAAVQDEWNYVPFGGEMCGASNVSFSDAAKTFVEPGPDRVGSKYIKALYKEYTDATFTQKKVRLGAVGDTIKVTFKNMLKDQEHKVSMHPHGVWYDKKSEGSPYADGLPAAPGDALAFGDVVTYTWLVPERAGPGPRDMSSIMWMYHSHVNEAADPYAGLVGAIVITRPENANEDASPADVDREFVLSFSIMDENESFLSGLNFKRYLPATLTKNATAMEELVANDQFKESNLMHAINGYMYCNLPGLQFVQGQTVRLYFMALGSKTGLHTPNTAESQLFINGHRKQSVQLLPGAMITVDTRPMVSGKGLLQCAVYDHMSGGMSALYDVKNLGILAAPPNAPVRTYYIAAEPIMWDYAPLGYDGCSGAPWSEDQLTFVKTTNETLGSQYKKAVFREYTDDTFTTKKPHPPESGILGPLIGAEVGDKIVVHFLNRLRFNASLQVFGGLAPMGNTSRYQVNLAESESAAASPPASAGRRLLQRAARRGLQQITAAQAEAEAVIAQSVENIYALGQVGPSQTYKYEWYVPDDAGPASRDGSSVVYAYVSGVDHIKHINAGLVGPLVVYQKGKLDRPDVDLEVPLLFTIQNERQSVLFEDNMQLQQNKTKLTINRDATSFPESNLMHTINGYVYCNGPTLQLPAGSSVRWYVMGFGSEADMHSPVFEGQDVSYAGQPVYSVGVMPSNTFTVDMVANTTGTWQYYCNILDHINAGMRSRMLIS